MEEVYFKLKGEIKPKLFYYLEVNQSNINGYNSTVCVYGVIKTDNRLVCVAKEATNISNDSGIRYIAHLLIRRLMGYKVLNGCIRRKDILVHKILMDGNISNNYLIKTP